MSRKTVSFVLEVRGTLLPSLTSPLLLAVVVLARVSISAVPQVRTHQVPVTSGTLLLANKMDAVGSSCRSVTLPFPTQRYAVMANNTTAGAGTARPWLRIPTQAPKPLRMRAPSVLSLTTKAGVSTPCRYGEVNVWIPSLSEPSLPTTFVRETVSVVKNNNRFNRETWTVTKHVPTVAWNSTYRTVYVPVANKVTKRKSITNHALAVRLDIVTNVATTTCVTCKAGVRAVYRCLLSVRRQNPKIPSPAESDTVPSLPRLP